MERPSKCDHCQTKPCENNPHNPDEECWYSAIAEYIAQGGVVTEEMLRNTNEGEV